MKILNRQLAILLGILTFLVAASSAATGSTAVSTAVSAPSTQTEAQNDDDDEADDWIFDAGPYTNNPKTGKRVWQYAKDKPAYLDAPNYYPSYSSGYNWMAPRYYFSDPFFMPNTDSMFFMNTPDPFYAEPTGYPIYYGGGIELDNYFYRLGY